MAQVRLETNGKSVRAGYSQLGKHPDLNIEMANMELIVGEDTICIRFETWQEMIKFCDDHNFKYQFMRQAESA